jgi:NodT family efflux transporter outer membrane factor (OMF) lipoprotein
MLATSARRRVSVALCGLLGGCAVGPDFQRPATADAPTYVESPLPATIPAPTAEPGGEAQNLRAGADLAHDWWSLFHSEPLNRFIEAALRDSPSLAEASAALRQAQETLAANRGSLLLPAVNGQLGAERERASGATIGENIPPQSFNLLNAGVTVSYTFDLFGSIRRQLEALQAEVDYEQNELRAAQLTLTANIVTAVIREAEYRDEIEALRAVEKLQRSGLQIVERRFALGAVTRTDVLSQRTALAQTIASISPLELQREQNRHLLAVYAGKAPSELDLAAVDIGRLDLPTDLPVSLPSQLARQRPDILAAEALMHQASAQVGVATANLYPQITLGGNVGYEALSASQLFKPDSLVWGLSANLAQPIFRGGALQAQRRAAIAAYDSAAAAYRLTVLNAFANVADSLRALDLDAQTLAAEADAYTQARTTAELAQRQFDVGAVSFLSLLSAQQQYSQAAVAVAQARASRFIDTATLFQALGGGWWNEATPAAKPLASAR